MKSQVFVSLFLLYLNISFCSSHAVLYINTKQNDILNQNDPPSGVNIFSIHNEADKEVGKHFKFRDDYTLHGGHGFYKYHNYPALWRNAKYICELEGAHLVVINSQSEADLVLGIIKLYPKALNVDYDDYISVGIHAMYKPGEYVTVTGGLVSNSGYTKWNKGQPDGGDQQCGFMRFDGSLWDGICKEVYSFMCEKEL